MKNEDLINLREENNFFMQNQDKTRTYNQLLSKVNKSESELDKLKDIV